MNYTPVDGGISKLQALIRRRQSGRFNEINAVIPLSIGHTTDDNVPPGLLYVTNLPGATAVFTSTPPFVATLSPTQQLLRSRNVRCVVSLLSPTGEDVACSSEGEVLNMQDAAVACPSLRPYLGTTECPDFCAATATISSAGRLRPYPVYIRIPILADTTNDTMGFIESTVRLMSERVALHEKRLLELLEVVPPASTLDVEIRVPMYHIHVPVEDNHTTRLASFLPILLPLMYLFTNDGGLDADCAYALRAGKLLLGLTGDADSEPSATPRLSPSCLTPKSWAALASQPVTPNQGPHHGTPSPPSVPHSQPGRSPLLGASLPPTLAALTPQRKMVVSSWGIAHTFLHQAQLRLRALFGDAVAPQIARVTSSWASVATGSASPSYPCSVLVHCLQGISRSGSVAIAFSMMMSHARGPVPKLSYQDNFFAALESVQRGRSFIDPNAAFRAELVRISQLWDSL